MNTVLKRKCPRCGLYSEWEAKQCAHCGLTGMPYFYPQDLSQPVIGLPVNPMDEMIAERDEARDIARDLFELVENLPPGYSERVRELKARANKRLFPFAPPEIKLRCQHCRKLSAVALHSALPMFCPACAERFTEDCPPILAQC